MTRLLLQRDALLFHHLKLVCEDLNQGSVFPFRNITIHLLEQMETAINLQIILTQPPPNVLFGLQKGSGNMYETIQKQKSASEDLLFTFQITIKGDKGKDALPKFSGPFVQGPAGGKFVYIDIGQCAGQFDTAWSRRLKVPLTGITWELIDQLIAEPTSILETNVPGTGKDGGPNCATVKPFAGWRVKT